MSLILTLLLAACGTEEPAALTCAEGELLDGERCVPEACGIGTWGNLQTDEVTVYVDASAEAGGDGSKESPFTIIQEGIDAQDQRAMVAVAAGTYQENVQITGDHAGVHLAGRCRELVTIDASAGEELVDEAGSGINVVTTGLADSWAVSGLTTSGAPWSGIHHVQGTLVLDRVASVGNRYCGLLTGYGTLVASDFTARDNMDVGLFVVGSAATRRRDITVVRSLYRFLRERGMVDSDRSSLLRVPLLNNRNPRPV
ncbi:MAG: hypothetical protein QGG40_20235, partial [Myxococcota bacterium]|nr:hypothetical protein [Myxococcota bacterium]